MMSRGLEVPGGDGDAGGKEEMKGSHGVKGEEEGDDGMEKFGSDSEGEYGAYRCIWGA